MTKKFEVSNTDEVIEFEIGKDTFQALSPGNLPGAVIMRYAEEVGAGKLWEAHKKFFSRVLLKDSAELFTHRLDSTDNPITLSTMAQVAEFLTEQYSNFGTAPVKP